MERIDQQKMKMLIFVHFSGDDLHAAFKYDKQGLEYRYLLECAAKDVTYLCMAVYKACLLEN